MIRRIHLRVFIYNCNTYCKLFIGCVCGQKINPPVFGCIRTRDASDQWNPFVEWHAHDQNLKKQLKHWTWNSRSPVTSIPWCNKVNLMKTNKSFYLAYRKARFFLCVYTFCLYFHELCIVHRINIFWGLFVRFTRSFVLKWNPHTSLNTVSAVFVLAC